MAHLLDKTIIYKISLPTCQGKPKSKTWDLSRHRSSLLVVFCAASAHQNINPKVARKVWFQRQTHRQTTELCTLYIAQCGMRQSLRRMRQSLRRMRSCSALHSSVGHIMGVAVHCGPYCGCCSALWEYLSAILFLNSVRTKSKKDRRNTSSFRVLAELRRFER